MQQYLEAGKVVTTHGVRGEMKLELWCDGVDFLKKTGRLYASAKGGKCYNIISIRPQGQMALLQLEGVEMTRETLVKIERGIQHIQAVQLRALRDALDTSYDELPLLLNVKQLVDLMGVSDSSIYELIQEDDFPSLRIGKRIVVPKEELRKWIAAHTKGASEC